MKKFVFIITLLSVTLKLFAQDCSQYMFMKKNRVIESTSYNKKGDVLRKVVSTVTNITTTNGVTTASVSAEYFDKSGKSDGKKSIAYKCDGSKFMMDIGGGGTGKAGASDKLSVSSLEYPTDMKVGDHLSGATSEMENKIGGTITTATSQITDRTVVGKENITTPAGTWSCLKITYKTTVTLKGYKMAPQTIESAEWYAPNFGIIKFQIMDGLTTEITGLK
jgi:hypothetical protein